MMGVLGFWGHRTRKKYHFVFHDRNNATGAKKSKSNARQCWPGLTSFAQLPISTPDRKQSATKTDGIGKQFAKHAFAHNAKQKPELNISYFGQIRKGS